MIHVDKDGRRGLWPEISTVLFLLLFVLGIYAARLTRLPLVGEETRWAGGAIQMIDTGDWIVPRQQGEVFPERPPMTMWGMAVVGLVRGEVDALAVRLPSVLAIALTSLLVYGYARQFLTRFAAFASALIYATMGQVLQIGRMGESEALFTLLVSASLLFWHSGYVRRWHPAWTWMVGFGCAALAALVKGPQAPVYFVAITGVYLLVRRDWRYLVGWPVVAGGAVFLAVIALWQIPFYLATDWSAVVATWAGLAGDRFTLGGLAEHLLTYPLETFACLLPWSPLLVALAKRETRVRLDDQGPLVSFLVTALLVAYPSVLLAAGARGRYFMPLYPCAAVLIGLIIDRCATAPRDCYPRRAWHQFLLLSGSLIVVSGLVFGTMSLLPGEAAHTLHQPRWLGFLLALLAAGVAYALWTCYRSASARTQTVAVTAIALFVGLAHTCVLINVHAARWNDPAQVVADLRSRVSSPDSLVSLGPIDHRFAYYYDAPIAVVDWPLEVDDLPGDVDYFVFMRYPGDTAERRTTGRGRIWWTTPGTLPFAWEEVASLCAQRRVNDGPNRMVVLGRVVRPLQAGRFDATAPHVKPVAARPSDETQRK